MYDIKDPVSKINGIGPRISYKLNSSQIYTISDLLYFFPRAYIDCTRPLSISNYRIGQDALIKAKISNIKFIRTSRKKMAIVNANLEDELGNTIVASWFNQPYLVNILKEGEIKVFYGKIGFDFSQKIKCILSPKFFNKCDIVPVYKEISGINSNFFVKHIKELLKNIKIDEFLPTHLLNKYSLISLKEALSKIHTPKNQKDIIEAKKRLGFDELFKIILKMQLRKYKFQKYSSYSVKIDFKVLMSFIKNLPFKLTKSQDKCLTEISSDMAKNKPMIRLLNGDVGSGKTIIATLSSFIVSNNKLRSLWMAPTEILATQHYNSLKKYFRKYSISISLITANYQIQFKNGKENIKPSQKELYGSDIIVGTHALLYIKKTISNVGLVVVDEEHRFGVKQRALLVKKFSKNNKSLPHYLSMSATPIPRTLALSIYADMNISIIDEMPLGRKKIITRLVSPINRNLAYDFIKKQINFGRQAFVICPLIDQNNENQDELFSLDKKAVMEEYNNLKNNIFKNYNIYYLHGRMKSKEKNKIMEYFDHKKIDILVATSVIEVGVDIPNANIMIIEDAENFGLAQLHQFRGRIGRGQHQSYCFLFTSKADEKTQKRLTSMEKFTSGFKLSEIDLAFRGPGEFTGNRQTGFDKLKIASLTDTIMLNYVVESAKWIIKEDINKFPKVKEKISLINE